MNMCPGLWVIMNGGFEASATDPKALPADLRRTVLGIVAYNADAASWDKLHAMAKKETSSLIRDQYYGLLAARQIVGALQLQAQALDPLVKMDPAPALRLAQLELRQGLVEAQKQADELADLMNQLLALPPGTVLELTEPELPAVPETTADEAAALAVGNSPQIREAAQNIL